MMTPEERHQARLDAHRRYRERNRAKINEQERIRKLLQRDRRKKWNSSSPEKRKEYYLRYHGKARTQIVQMEQRLRMKFGIGVAEYERLLDLQSHGCAICGTPDGGVHQRSPNPAKWTAQRLAVDHDHVTGEIRGLLCRKCNQGLGLFCDDPEIVARAMKYLKKGAVNGTTVTV